MKRKRQKGIGKVILRSVPNPEVERKVAEFLVRLLKGVPPEKIRARVRNTPVVLARRVAAKNGERIAGHLEKLGAKASFVPLRPAELKNIPEKAEAPRVRETAVPIVPPPDRTRKKRLRYAAAALLMLGALAFLGLRIHEIMVRPVPPELVFLPIEAEPAPAEAEAVQGAGDAFRLRYRLKPDRRLITAFSVLADRFSALQGSAGEPVFRLGTVQANARECLLPLLAGQERIEELRLPLPLTFADAMAGLDRWQAMLARHFEDHRSDRATSASSPGPAEASLPDMDGGPLEVLEALQAVQHRWDRSGPQTGLLRAASRGYAVLLTLLHPDDVHAADPLFPFALSLTAVSSAGDAGPRQLDRALLARAMGYGPQSVDSRAGNAGSGQDRVLAAFLRKDTAALASMRENGSLLADYLLVRSHRDRSQHRLADEAARRLLDKNPLFLPALADAAAYGDLSTAKSMSVMLPVFLFLQMEAGPFPGGGIFGNWTASLRWFSDESSDVDLSLARFESMLAQKVAEVPNAASGVLYDSERAAAIWRGLYFNAMALRYRMLSDRWQKPLLAEKFARRLAKKSPRHPLVLSMLAKNAQDLSRPGEAIAYLEEILADPTAPAAMAAEIYAGIDSEFDRISYWERIFNRLDGRPAHLAFAGQALYRLMNLDLAETYTSAALKLNPRYLEGYVLQADITGLDSGLQDALNAFPDQRSLVLSAAAHFAASRRPGAKEAALDLYRKLYRQQPSDVRSAVQICTLLLDLGRRPEAMLFLESLIKAGPEDRDTATELRLMLAKIHLDRDEPRRALDTIAGAPDAFAPRVLVAAALANEALGNQSKAQEYFRMAAARGKTDPEVLLSLAAFYWRRENNRQAAAYIGRMRTAGSRPLRYEEAFVRATSDASLKQVGEAVEALVDSGAEFGEIHRIAVYYAEREKDVIALNLLARCPTGGAVEEMEKRVSRFRIIGIGQGELKALQFLADTVQPSNGRLLARILYQRGMFDAILAEFIRPEAHLAGSKERVWLYRLIAWLATGKKSRSEGAQLENHYRDPYEPVGDSDHRLQRTEGIHHAAGRYLMGKITAEALLSASPEVGHRAQSAYYIGLSHRFDGDFPEATKWYHICRNLQAEDRIESRWATRELSEWQAAGARNRQRLWERPFG